jgi:hypothetical protein
MSDWSLARVLENLHSDIQNRLLVARSSFAHPGTKGDASENIWIEVLRKYLPQRYQAENAHVVDSTGVFSQQIDVVVFDRQYSPFIFNFQGQVIVPAESVYAVFEAKQTIDAAMVKYAQEKVASVRKLQRTSLPIPHAGGVYPAKPLIPILGGILTFESEWNPPLGYSLANALTADHADRRLDLGCVAAHGYFYFDAAAKQYAFKAEKMPATAFLFRLIAQLQFSGTVPMIDIEAYSRWLTPPAL